MDRTSILVLVICFVVLMLWYPLVVNKLYPAKPVPPRPTNAPPTTLTATNGVAPPPVEAPIQAPTTFATTNVLEDLVMVTNENARYTFTSLGGGLKLIELVKYREN